MAYDGSLVFDTKVDESGFDEGIVKIGGLAKTGLGVVTGAIAAAGTAIVAIGKQSIEIGMNFEKQMSRVGAIAGVTGEELRGLTELAKTLGADTAFSATEAAAGMENLASAGFSANEIMGAMPGLLDLAAVSGGDVALASEVAASALRAFGLEASQAGHVADVFARAAADTNAEVGDMGEAMKFVAPVAAAMGISIEETAAAIGIMSDSGIKGSLAGTALKNAILALSSPSDKARGIMDDLGLSFFDAEGNMASLKEQVGMLETAFVGLTQEEKIFALEALYGKQALSGMLALIDGGSAKIDTLTQSLINSDGAAQDMATTMQDNLAGDVEALGGSLETLGIQIYETLQPALRSLAQEGAASVDNLVSAFENGGLEGAISALGEEIANWVANIASHAPKLVEAAVGLVKSFIEGYKTNLPEISAGAVDIVEALVNGILELLPVFAETGLELLLSLASGIAEALPELFPKITETCYGIQEMFYDNLPEIIKVGGELVLGIAEGMLGSISVMLETAPTLVQSLIEGITGAIPMLIGVASELIMMLATYITENLPTIIQTAIDIVLTIIEGILSSLPGLASAALELIISLVSYILSNLPAIIASGVEIIASLASGIISAVGMLISTGDEVANELINEFLSQDWLSIGGNIIESIANGIKSGINKVIGVVKDLWNSVTGIFKGDSGGSGGLAGESGASPMSVTPFSAMGTEAFSATPKTMRSFALPDMSARLDEAVAANAMFSLNPSIASGTSPNKESITDNSVVEITIYEADLSSEISTKKIGKILGEELNKSKREKGGLY